MGASGIITLVGGSLLALIVAGIIAQKRLPPPKPKVIGIDLGTTYSCVGVYHAITGDIEIFGDEEGRKTFPSVVAVSESNILVGYDALRQMKMNPEYTYYDAKRFIGRRYCALESEDTKERYQFHVVNLNGEPVFSLPKENVLKNEYITPEGVGSEILRYLVKLAEQRLKSKVSKAVISVPAKFNEKQRNATRRAATMAGLEVMQIIQEPTAAAMAYGLHNRSDVSMVMVVDLGGGTLDVSLLRVQGGMFLTVATAGNNRLGGQDFNEHLLAYIQKNLSSQFGCVVSDVRQLQELHEVVEQGKLDLTNQLWTELHVPLCDRESVDSSDRYTSLNVSRELFEKLNHDLFYRALEPIKIVLDEAGTEKGEVDEIVLVGGSTRVPKIRQIISEFFGGKVLNVAVDPDLAVVYGCSNKAGIISGMWPLKVSAIEIPFQTTSEDNC